MSKVRFLKHHRSRRIAALCVVVFLWLTLIYWLPRDPSNVVAAVGFVVGMIAYCQWADDPKERPKRGCFINIPIPPIEIELSHDIEAKRAVYREQQTLLRATETESPTQQELLRPAASAEACTPQEMLRSSDKPE